MESLATTRFRVYDRKLFLVVGDHFLSSGFLLSVSVAFEGHPAVNFTDRSNVYFYELMNVFLTAKKTEF